MFKIDLESEWEKQVLGAKWNIKLQNALLQAQVERLRRIPMKKTIRDVVLATVLDRDLAVKGVGFNVPQDLILDNFGRIFGKIFHALTNTRDTVDLKDLAGATKTVFIYRDDTRTWTSTGGPTGAGSRIQIGKGTATPARGDYCIGDAFTTAPESSSFETGPGSYASTQGAASCNGQITAGGSGTIRESLFIWRLVDQTTGLDDIAIFHNSISPPINFSANNLIVIVYAVMI